VSTPSSPDITRPAGVPVQGGALAWLRSLSATTQASVPGLYAWAVTVAPVFTLHAVSVLADITGVLGLASILAGPIVERRAPRVARLVLFWGLAASAIATWMLAPEALAARFDAPRGIAGMFGWALFAFAIASPARPLPARTTSSTAPLELRRGEGLDTAFLLAGLALALVLEVPGWSIVGRDRVLLARVVAVAGGLGVVGAASAIAVARHRPSHERARRRRRARLTVGLWVLLACLMMTAGTAATVLRTP
jgi:hypothetical protein